MKQLLLVLAFAAVACGNNTPSPVATPTRFDAAPGAPAPAVVIGGARVELVGVARTEAERERGLMYVNYLPADDGMLFIFDVDSVLSFWMKNTLIPLDMIFIGEDRAVVGIVANAEPLTLTARTAGPCRYVLEVNGGWAAEHGVGAGTQVRFEHVTP